VTSPCTACSKRCCHDYVVTVNSYDVWRLARGLRLDPRQFVVPVRPYDPASHGFRLEPGGVRHQLALDKVPGSPEHRACVFWMPVGPDAGRCGVYPLRPGVCRTYPAALVDGTVSRREDVLCPTEGWRHGELDDPAWKRRLDHLHVAYDIHGLLLTRWNLHVEQTAHPERLSFHGFLTYLLAFHEALVPVWELLGAEDFDVLASGWAARAASGTSPLATYVPDLAGSAAVFAGVRAVAATFFVEDGACAED
jgi:Fe-S-cluster containining protein